MLNKLKFIWYGITFILLMGLLSCNKSRIIDMEKRNEILYDRKKSSIESYSVSITQYLDDKNWILSLLIYFNNSKPDIKTSLIYNQSTQSFLVLRSGQSLSDSKALGKVECLDTNCTSLKGILSLSEISPQFEDNEKNKIDIIFQRYPKKIKLTILDDQEHELESIDNLKLFINGYKDIESSMLLLRNELIGNGNSNYSTIFYITDGSLYYNIQNDFLETVYLRNASFKSFLSGERNPSLEMIPCTSVRLSQSNTKCGKFETLDPATLTLKNYLIQFSEIEGL